MTPAQRSSRNQLAGGWRNYGLLPDLLQSRIGLGHPPMNEQTHISPPEPSADPAAQPRGTETLIHRPSAVAAWGWFIAKNAIGWLLILASMVIGPIIPGPGGIPIFLLGFGLVTFPGKRRLTARVLRGRPVVRESRAYRRGSGIFALLFPGVVLGYLLIKEYVPHYETSRGSLIYGSIYIGSALAAWLIVLHSDGLLNRILRLVPKIRKKIRPWLRRAGIDLLPPRRRRRFTHPGGPETRAPDEEILEIHERHHRRLGEWWAISRPWLKRLATVAITVMIFIWMFKPIAQHWPVVRERILELSLLRFFIAAAMFSIFLFVFRVTTWRWILRGFGYRVPVAAATRIWSTSELARFVPGVIWQVVGRVYLVKPYGVRGSVCTTSQILELAIFLLANVLLAVSCLVWLGVRSFDETARPWLFGALALVPLLIFLLHPKVLYRMTNFIMGRLGKPSIRDRMGFRILSGLTLWTVLGLVWQGLAIWFLVSEPLELPLRKWWVVAGAYSLAWCAGFLSVFSPGGLGVRELVFMAAMRIALPPWVAEQVGNEAALAGLLAFLSVLLRLWATSGELIVTGLAYAADFRGAVHGPAARLNKEETSREPNELEPTA